MSVSFRPSRPTLGDLRGGVVSAALAIPLAMAYGMFAFVALGDDYFSTGVLAGLWSAIVTGFVCVLAGNTSTTVYAPRVTTTFYLGSVLFALAHSDLPVLRSGVATVVAVFFAIIFLGGAFQALFGWMRLGSLIKFTPHPVMAGFQNAAALLLVLVQTNTVLGLEGHWRMSELPQHLGEIRLWNLVVAAITVLAMLKSRKWLPRVPPALAGLAAGSVAYYALVAVGQGSALGPVIGSMPEQLLQPMDAGLLGGLFSGGDWSSLASLVLFAALGLAFIASMDALLCERLLRGASAPSPSSDPQLVRLGLGNMLSALSGGITAGVNLGPSAVNRARGATTVWSVLVNAGVILLTLLVAMPLLAYLPRVALSAVVVVVGFQHVDPWTVQLARRLIASPALRRSALALELAVVVAVALLSVLFNIVVAVFTGVLIAMAVFLMRMSRSVVRRSYRCDTHRSRKTRDADLMVLLAAHGQRILAFELEGPIFFGSAERLASQVRAALDADTCEIVLDFRRVSDIDSTGAWVLEQLDAALNTASRRVRYSGMQRRGWAAWPGEPGPLQELTAARQYPDIDRAIEAAEDALIDSLPQAATMAREAAFDELDLFDGLDAAQLVTVRSFLSQREFAPGEILFREGDAGTDLFVITQGRASVELRQPDGPAIRLATFAAGTTFGELAILDQQARSATVVADTPLACFVLSADSFDAMKVQAPAIAIRLLMNLGGELGRRMRRANQMVFQLAS